MENDKMNFEEIIKQTNFIVDRLIGKHESVCVCGSSRFCDLIAVVKWEIEKKGIMATGLHLLPKWYTEGMNYEKSDHAAEQENVAHILDDLHLKKIVKSSCVVVVNPNNYIGERTNIEIEYAHKKGIEIFYWMPQSEKPNKE